MSDNSNEFTITSDVMKRLLQFKNQFSPEDSWDDFFKKIFPILSEHSENTQGLENVMKSYFYENFYEMWVQNFALNLNDIWNEHSSKNLGSTNNNSTQKNSAIVIGKGPSIKAKNHLKILANSNFSGIIICTDGALIDVLQAGITPEKFPHFYVVTVDAAEIIATLYDHPIVDKFGKNIKGIFTTVSHPKTLERARKANIQINWMHALFDYAEGKKSFNQISALMTRSKNHVNGLPAIQTGGNVGTSSWFVGWKILKCNIVALIGIDHGWTEDVPWEIIMSHGNSTNKIDISKKNPNFEKLFPKIYNPDFNCNCILDPIFQYYSSALKEFISRSPSHVTTINATEGGSIFGHRINSMKFSEFLEKDFS